MYAERNYSNREKKSHMAFERLSERFIAYYCLYWKGKKTVTNDENAINIFAVPLNLTISTKKLLDY